MSTEGLAAAMATARSVLENVKPEHLDRPSPCASWDVRHVANHLIGGAHWFAICTNNGAAPDVDTTEDTDYTAENSVAAYDAAVAEALAAFDAPGAQERMITLPFGTFPGAAFMGIATVDQFTHAWDLARATGQSTDLAPELAEQLLAGAKGMIGDAFRGPDGVAPFGAEVPIDDSAPAADRLAAFLGRAT
ncbi:MAG TPA: TIGR03086 family metal-binding protein [Ilumatobacteraceae bacterium]|nr:TIGR03086 family metal-binding protein [Ilumatobacteraceae bacterium]HUC32783.1 TIGR03086 family metal-binding protein [Ilumatobacteraceae bacterium]